MRARSFTFDEHTFVIHRRVFDPVRHLSGLAFAGELEDLVEQCVPTARTAVDLGTGSGLLAATLARLGLTVVATDISGAAVRCAAQNCRGLDVDVRRGDLFGPVAGETFDVAVVNPPYGRTPPTWFRSSALTSPDFLERLGVQVHEFARIAVLGFPAHEASVLEATGLELVQWRTVQTSGHDLGLFVSVADGTI